MKDIMGRASRSIKRSRRAVSVIIATLILIGVVAAMGSFIYWYAVTYARSTSKITSITITDAKITKTSSDQVSVMITLKNQGTIAVELLNATIYDNSGPKDLLALSNTLLSPNDETIDVGGSLTIVYVGNEIDVDIGETYNIVVVTDQGAQQVVVECSAG